MNIVYVLVILLSGIFQSIPEGTETPTRPEPPMRATMSADVENPYQATIQRFQEVIERTTTNGCPTAQECTELPFKGRATYYAEGVIERTIYVQSKINGNIPLNPCPTCFGYVAMLWPGDMNRIVCIRDMQAEGQPVYGPFYVVDSAQARHRPGLVAQIWVVDIGLNSWKSMGFPTNDVRQVQVEFCQ